MSQGTLHGKCYLGTWGKFVTATIISMLARQNMAGICHKFAAGADQF